LDAGIETVSLKELVASYLKKVPLKTPEKVKAFAYYIND
jgi:hypothetical protein